MSRRDLDPGAGDLVLLLADVWDHPRDARVHSVLAVAFLARLALMWRHDVLMSLDLAVDTLYLRTADAHVLDLRLDDLDVVYFVRFWMDDPGLLVDRLRDERGECVRGLRLLGVGPAPLLNPRVLPQRSGRRRGPVHHAFSTSL